MMDLSPMNGKLSSSHTQSQHELDIEGCLDEVILIEPI
jgi:hypothetical protein